MKVVLCKGRSKKAWVGPLGKTLHFDYSVTFRRFSRRREREGEKGEMSNLVVGGTAQQHHVLAREKNHTGSDGECNIR